MCSITLANKTHDTWLTIQIVFFFFFWFGQPNITNSGVGRLNSQAQVHKQRQQAEYLAFVGSDRSSNCKTLLSRCHRTLLHQSLGCYLDSWWLNLLATWLRFITDYVPAEVRDHGRCIILTLVMFAYLLTWANLLRFLCWGPYGDVYPPLAAVQSSRLDRLSAAKATRRIMRDKLWCQTP